MAWNNEVPKQQATEQKEESLAYINKETRELAKQDPQISELADAVLAKTKEMAEAVKEAGLTTTSQTRDKSKTYTDKFAVNVEYATDKDGNAMLHKKGENEGKPILRATAEYSHGGTKATIFFSEQGNPTKAMAQKWSRNEVGNPKLNIYKLENGENDTKPTIAEAPINKDVKAIIAEIQKQGFFEKEVPFENAKEASTLKNIAYEANQYFNANSEKVPNKDGELVNNAYAQFDSYTKTDPDTKQPVAKIPSVSLRNHEDNVVIELSIKDGEPVAKSLNFELNEKNEPRQKDEPPAFKYINNSNDLEALVTKQEIKDIVSDFKQLSQERDKGKTKDKEQTADDIPRF